QRLHYQVRMKISMSIMWEVEPQKILSYTAVEGGKTGVEKALVEVMRRSIREKAQHLSDTQVLTGQTVFEEAVRAALKTPLEDESGMTLVERLGIKIIKVQTTKIVPSSEELTQRYERLRGEDLDQIAETKQANHVADNLVDKFRSKGVTPDMAFLGALAMTKDARLVGVVGNAGDFTKGQVAAGEGGK
ncbi:MAG: SPFH domain-containing protein, partial [Patescibacteria group bacterium]